MKAAETTRTPVRTMYSLDEAAALTRCSVDELLQHGREQRLSILAHVPDNVSVFCTNQNLLDLAAPTLAAPMWQMQEFRLRGVLPLASQDIQLLVLDAADCGLVASHGYSHQALFRTGIAFNGEYDPVIVEPAAIGGELDIPQWRLFACYSVDYDPRAQSVPRHTAPMKIKLTTDMLHVRRDDLVSLDLLRVAGSESVEFDNGFREAPHMSERLIFLNKGARHFWDRSHPDWSATSSAEVEFWFREEGKFGAKLAKGAAQILRQSYKDWDQARYEKEKAKNKLNMFDAVVLIASRWANADLGSGNLADQIDTYPDCGEALETLMTDFGFAEHLARQAWSIVTPAKARKMGRPKEYDTGM